MALVPGATPKKPASGLIAYRRPSEWGLIQAMSSPIVRTVQPSKPFGGISIAKLVLPQADGNAAATWYLRPSGDVTARISMCSANQPTPPANASCRPMFDAIRNAKHFLPSRALPPYPDPNDQISRVSG